MAKDPEAIAGLSSAAAVETVAAVLSGHGIRADNCTNCGAPLIGPYCAMCGQERNSPRHPVSVFIRGLFDEIVNFDGRGLRTAAALIARPGELSLAFQQGRRRRYIPALRLYLFVSVIFFLVLGATGLAIAQLQIVATPAATMTDASGRSFLVAKDRKPVPIPDWMAREPGPHYSTEPHVYFFARIGDFHNHLSPAALANLDRDMRRGGRSDAPGAWGVWVKSRVLHALDALAVNPAAVNGPLTVWIPRVLFVLLPLYALLLATFYWRQRKRYFLVDHLVFSLNIHSFVFVAILLGVGVAQLMSGQWAALATLAAIGLYILLAIRRFYRQSWFWTCAKFAGISSAYTMFFLFPAIAAIIMFSLLQT
jgi:hypothetical protein